MKNLLLMLSLLLGQPVFCQAQRLGDYLNNLVAPLDKTEITSGFLWDKGTNGFVEPAIYDGTLRDSVYLQPTTFGFLYIQARNAYIGTNTNPLPLPDVYMDYVKRYTGTDTIPLAALALRYNRIHQNAVDSNLLFLQSDQLFDVQNRAQSPYWQDTLFAFAPLKTDAWHNTVHFTLPNDLVWQNLGWSSPLLQADFADGQGWQTLAMGQTYTIQYDSGGVKTILTRIQQGSTTLEGKSIIFVAEQAAQERGEGPNYSVESPETIISIPGGGGDLRIFYGSPCNKLLKPFILVEGFELDDNTAQFTLRMKNLLIEQTPVITNHPTLPLGEWLYSQGYDIVWVNLANVQGYIQDNAEIVKAAVQKINEIKAANGSSEPNMIMGVSAGGIITKYMFAKTNSVPFDHQCEKFFSYDSPLSGANIPVSVQCLLQHINYIASEQGQNLLEGTPGLQPAFNALVSPFAQQTLLYRFYYPSGSNAGVLNGDTHYAFMAEMNALGPVPIRHIALANGSPTISERANISPGSHFFKVLTGGNGFAWTFPPGIPVFVNVNFEANGYAIPSQVNNLIYDGNLKIVVNGFLVKEYPEEVSSPESGKTYDTAPGSSSNLVIEALNAIDGTIVPNISYSGFPLANGEITVSLSPVQVSIYATHYCFIPTRSAISAGSDLSVNGPFNCSQGSSDRCTMNNIPTNLPASWGVSEPEENQDHVFLDARIGDVIVDEVDVANLIPGGSIPTSLNVYYNVGLPIQSGIPTVTISSTNGKLSVNNTGNVAYATGNEPVSPLTLLKAYTKCEAIVTVENGASLVVGADGSVKNGVLTVTESSIVHIKSGGILRVTGDQSSLIIKSGATLILDPGAKVILESNGANIRIEGELVINGNFNFSGPGHFVFAQGNQLTFGPNHNTFYLDGMGINQRYVRLEAPLRISDGHRLLWTDGLVEITDGNLDFTTGAGADFERVTFSGGGEAIIAQQASAINLLSCVATGVKYPIQGDQSFGLYVDQCQFDAYSKGIAWQNSAFFNVVRSSFAGQSAASAMDLQNVGLAMIGADYIAGHTNGAPGIVDDTYFSSSNAAAAVELSNVDYCVVRNSQINSNDVGIRDLNYDKPSNVFLIQGTTLFENVAGVYMTGNATEGLVLADCATFARNKFGVRGRDITLMIDALNSSISPLDEDQPNAFLRDPFGIPQAGGAQKYIEICYELKAASGSVNMRNNYWGTLAGAGQPWVYEPTPQNHINLYDATCNQTAALPVVLPRVGREPENCELPERPTTDFTDNDVLSECTTGINSTFGLVHEQYHYAYYLLKADSFELARQAFEPLAALWSSDMSGYPANCRQYIAVARAIVSGAGEQLRPEGRQATSSETSQQMAAWPNPASQTLHVLLPDVLCDLRVWDTFGRLMETRTASGAIQLQVEQWPSGVYYLESVASDGRRSNAKVAVGH